MTLYDEMRMNVYEQFIYENQAMGRRKLILATDDYEEQRQEFALAYFEHEEEMVGFIMNNKKKSATNLWLDTLRKNSVKYSKYGIIIMKRNTDYDAIKDFKVSNHTKEVFAITSNAAIDKIEARIILEELLGDDRLQFAMDYIDEGLTYTSVKYNINKQSVINRMGRIYKSIKKS